MKLDMFNLKYPKIRYVMKLDTFNLKYPKIR
jgi:hypothetical protein